MPFYQIFHALPLSTEQQQAMAEAITDIHARTFTAMTALINVDFVNVSGKPTYIGGHLRPTPSTVHASVRDGPSRTPEMYQSLCTEISQAWDRIVREGDSSFGLGQLRVFITGAFITGIEGGYQLPQAGQDQAWLQEHLELITMNAEAGHEESINMLESIKVMQSQGKGFIVG